LQEEFLSIQNGIKKTIVFVTHDIDEAIKMGDRIAILKQGGVLAQYDTPHKILSEPDSEFVSSFVGTDRVLKNLSLTRVGDVELEPYEENGEDLPRISDKHSLKDALSELIGADAGRGLVYSEDDSNGNGNRGTITLDRIQELSRGVEDGQ
jgi:osmoprotectant transport system ATP-binding protein